MVLLRCPSSSFRFPERSLLNTVCSEFVVELSRKEEGQGSGKKGGREGEREGKQRKKGERNII